MKRLISALLLLLAGGSAAAQGYLADVAHSSTSVLLPCIGLRALDDSPAGGTLQTGIDASTAGLEIRVKADNASSWTAYTQATSTINNKSGSVGSWEEPDVGDVHIKECETSGGTYQIDLPDSTWSVAGAKYVQILVRDVSSPTFADTLHTVNLNAISGSALIDLFGSEACSGHTTDDTFGDQLCDFLGLVGDNVTVANESIEDLTDGTTPVWGPEVNNLYTADDGSTTTITDTELNQADTDYWQFNEVLFVGGSTLVGQTRCVTGFSAANDELTLSPPLTQAVATDQQYILRSNAACGNFDRIIEDQGDGYSASDIMTLLLAEAMGVCQYTSSTRQWLCKDPAGNETRFTVTYGVGLDGTRTSSSTTPATP